MSRRHGGTRPGRTRDGARLHIESLKVGFTPSGQGHGNPLTKQHRIGLARYAEQTYTGYVCATCGKPALRRVRGVGACKTHLRLLDKLHP